MLIRQQIQFIQMADIQFGLYSVIDRMNRVVRSVWDDNRGRVYTEGGTFQQTVIFMGLLSKSVHGKRIRADGNVLEAYRRFIGDRTYGSPSFSKHDVQELFNQTNNNKTSAERRELNDEELENLKDLGYI